MSGKSEKEAVNKKEIEKEIIEDVEKEFTKQFDKKTIISALIISAILFSGGIFVGYSLNREKLTGIEYHIDAINSDMENFQLQFLFFDVLGENATCPLLESTLSNINEESYEIGTRLDQYGNDNELKDFNEYENLKKEYSRILVSYWLLANKLKESCKSHSSTIIFFIGKECVKCDEQAFVLTYLKEKLGEQVLIFTLDGTLDEPSIEVLKEYYNITGYPSLVINGEKFSGLTPIETINEKIDNTIS